MEVTINGVQYLPKNAQRFGVAVTTHNRNDTVADAVRSILSTVPNGTPVVVVDDGSTEPVSLEGNVKVIRHDTPRGIPAAKNRCIEELMDTGVEHLFLFDDDTWPIENDWYTGYLDSPEHHLQYSWTHFRNGTEVPRMHIAYQDSKLIAYGWSMGCMLYVSRQAVERVGGMRWEFGRGMEEHAEWSQRIHNAGLTTFVHQDIPTSDGLFWSGDKAQSVNRTLDWSDRTALLERNERLRVKHIDSTDYIDYRAQRDDIIAVFLNSREDPQRGTRLEADAKAIAPLQNSLGKHTLTVLTDCLPNGIKVESPETAYRQRWISYYQWLREQPIRYAWLIDATDVIMLNDPFEHMKPGTLYVGWEPKTVGIQWMRDNGADIIEWIDGSQQRMLLNAGVVGGDKATLIELCRRMNMMWAWHQSDAMHEMPFFNHVVYQHFSNRLITGPQVTTVFKQNITSDPIAWWAHK